MISVVVQDVLSVTAPYKADLSGRKESFCPACSVHFTSLDAQIVRHRVHNSGYEVAVHSNSEAVHNIWSALLVYVHEGMIPECILQSLRTCQLDAFVGLLSAGAPLSTSTGSPQEADRNSPHRLACGYDIFFNKNTQTFIENTCLLITISFELLKLLIFY